MAEVVGFVASITALIQLTGKLTALGYGYISDVKRAPKEVADLVNELGSLGKELIALKDYTDRHPSSKVLQRLNGKDGALQICLNDLSELQSNLETGGGLKASLKWPIKEKDMLHCISRMERQKNLIIFALTAESLSLSKEIERHVENIDFVVHDLQDAAVAQKTLNSAEKRAKVLTWLYVGDHSTKHVEITGRRQPNTGQWLLKAPEFKELGQHPSSQLVWGYGIPGAGKTFLSSLVIDYLEEEAVTGNYGVAYIYFDYQERSQQRPLQVLASLVKQLVAQIGGLPKYIETWYDKLEAKGKRVKFEELYEIFLETLKSFSRVFLVFDALDECDPQSQRRELLPLFHRMGRSGASLFITSRQYPEDIQQSFRSCVKIELSARKEDIEIYVQQRIDDSPRVDRLVKQTGCQDRIVSQLVDCAQGMFLVVYFHIEYLCQQTTAKQLLAALAKLGSVSAKDGPLDSAYGRCIETIRNQPKNCAQLGFMILLWLVKAQRALTVDELRVAVSIEPEKYELDDMDLPAKATILDVCAGLVIVDTDSNNIRLAHYTVKEYLQRTSIISDESNITVAIACATYVSFEVFSGGACISYEAYRARIGLYPFLDYAAHYLSYHLRACDEDLLASTVLKLLGSQGNLASAVQVFRNLDSSSGKWTNPKSYQGACVPLYIASYLGQVSIVRKLLKDGDTLLVCDSEGQTPLQTAAAEGHTAVVQVVIENGADFEERNKYGHTTLYVAAAGGHREVVLLLLDKGADIEARTLRQCTPLHAAAYAGHEGVARLLLERGADVSAMSDEGVTPLLTAAGRGHGGVVELLLQKKLDLSVQDHNGSSALHHGAFGGDKAVVQLLLAHGADIAALGADGDTALIFAASGGHETVVRLLLEKGSEVSLPRNDGKTALHYAAAGGHAAVVQLLLDKDPNTSIKDKVGDTPLQMTARGGHEVVAHLLLDKGASASEMNDNGSTALHSAAFYGYTKVAQVLLDKGADVSTQDKDGFTPLLMAARQGHEAVAKLLLDNGADVSVPSNKGSTAIHHAVIGGFRVLVELFLDKGASLKAVNMFGNNCLHLGAYSGNIEIIQLLFAKGEAHPVQNKTGMTALHFAALGGHGAAIQLLLDKDNNLSARGGEDGYTPLHYAVKGGNIEAVQLLLEKGSDKLARDDTGNTVLHIAAAEGHKSVVQFLLEKGSDLSATNNTGDTVLHSASSGGSEPVVQLLLDEGADISIQNNDGETVLQHAVRAKKNGVVSLLEAALNGPTKGMMGHWQNSVALRLYGDRYTYPVISYYRVISLYKLTWL